MGQRVAQTMGQSSLPVARSMFAFSQHGQAGTWVSELLPHTAKIVDDITVIKTMNTDAINHDPAITFIQTGFQQPGRPSMGAWLSYGLGSENQNLPAFVVLLSQAQALNTDQPLFSRLWGSGFLPSSYQGVRFRAGAAPVLYLEDPPGVDKTSRRQMLDAVAKLDTMKFAAYGDQCRPRGVASAPNRSGRSIGVIIAPKPPLDLPLMAPRRDGVEGPVVRVDPRHDLVAQVRVVAPGAGGVHELAAAVAVHASTYTTIAAGPRRGRRPRRPVSGTAAGRRRFRHIADVAG